MSAPTPDPTTGIREALARLDRARSDAEYDLAILALRKAAEGLLFDIDIPDLAVTRRKRTGSPTPPHLSDVARRALDVVQDRLPLEEPDALAALFAHAAKRGPVIVTLDTGRKTTAFRGRLLNFNPLRPGDGATVQQGAITRKVPTNSVRITKERPQ